MATDATSAPPAAAPGGQHTEHEDDPWTINIPDHAERTDSPTFVAARGFAHKIMDTLTAWPYDRGPWQMHHGGSLWTFDDNGWFLVTHSQLARVWMTFGEMFGLASKSKSLSSFCRGTRQP